jgi:hypothetical protein
MTHEPIPRALQEARMIYSTCAGRGSTPCAAAVLALPNPTVRRCEGQLTGAAASKAHTKCSPIVALCTGAIAASTDKLLEQAHSLRLTLWCRVLHMGGTCSMSPVC